MIVSDQVQIPAGKWLSSGFIDTLKILDEAVRSE